MMRLCCCAFAACLTLGCSNPGGDLANDDLTYPKWDALDALTSGDLFRPLDMAASMKDANALKAAAKDPAFVAAIDALATEEIPSAFDSPERVAAKEECVAQFKKLIEGSGSAKEMEEAYKSAMENFSKITKPDSNT